MVTESQISCFFLGRTLKRVPSTYKIRLDDLRLKIKMSKLVPSAKSSHNGY